LRTLPVNVQIPLFWLGAGSSYHTDVHAAQAFQQILLARQPDVTLDIEPGGSHNMATWRALVPPMLEWMTPRLAQAKLHPQLYAGPGAPQPVHNVRPAPVGASPAATPSASGTAATPSASSPVPARSKATGVARRGRKA